MLLRTVLLVPGLLLLAACADDLAPLPPGPSANTLPNAPKLVINEVMADPSAVADDQGEWLEVHNWGSSAVSLQGWTLASGNDAAHTIATAVNVPAAGYAVLARSATKSKNGGVTAAYAYGTGLNLANASDWLRLRDASGATVDSVAWTSMPAGATRGVRNPSLDNTAVGDANWQTSTTTFGKGDRGTPGAVNNGYQAPGLPVATVAVSPASASIAVGGAQQFTAVARDANGTVVPTTFTWSSSATGVATVDGGGLATGLVAGSAAIRATAANGIHAEASLTVTASTGGGGASELVVRVLDVGQGDANLITNGTSTVLIDGGPSESRMGALLDSLGLNGTTIDVVILSHQHADHLAGLQELFRASRNITVRYFFENKDVYSSVSLAELRDSVNARAQRGQVVYRDTDDPCGNGAPLCTIALNGGARLHVMRPDPAGSTANNRSTPVKLVGPDSASFSMWFAGDAEHEAIEWFDTGADYDVFPGMDVDVLKADHHGSCNGVRGRYVELLTPDWVTFSLSATNTYGHVHEQTKALFSQYARPWYRTDNNGTITIRSPGTPGGGYTITAARGSASGSGAPDRASAAAECSSL
ncbi:MAG TPA: lamin tail domain-containing protein [Longimicrobium sp.]|nr:lamin tail domain-containing protein [Longimicrobium sp.]